MRATAGDLIEIEAFNVTQPLGDLYCCLARFVDISLLNRKSEIKKLLYGDTCH